MAGMTTLGVRRFTPGAEDVHGNAAKEWADPIDWDVYGIAPGANLEPGTDGNRDLSVIEWTVYGPVTAQAPGEYDLVRVDGQDYAVEGRPADWTRGPWPSGHAGIVVELRKADG